MTVPTPQYSAALGQELTNAAAEFSLGPEVYVDIGRLPVDIVTLSGLWDYLRTLRTRIGQNPDQLRPTGYIRQYKTFVLAVHCLANYWSTKTGREATVQAFADSAMRRARENVPQDLSEGGRRLWNASFLENNIRMRSVISAVLFLGSEIRDIPVGDGGTGGGDDSAAGEDGGRADENLLGDTGADVNPDVNEPKTDTPRVDPNAKTETTGNLSGETKESKPKGTKPETKDV